MARGSDGWPGVAWGGRGGLGWPAVAWGVDREREQITPQPPVTFLFCVCVCLLCVCCAVCAGYARWPCDCYPRTPAKNQPANTKHNHQQATQQPASKNQKNHFGHAKKIKTSKRKSKKSTHDRQKNKKQQAKIKKNQRTTAKKTKNSKQQSKKSTHDRQKNKKQQATIKQITAQPPTQGDPEQPNGHLSRYPGVPCPAPAPAPALSFACRRLFFFRVFVWFLLCFWRFRRDTHTQRTHTHTK